MNQEQDRCPLCSRKLVIIAGTPTCPDCGYRNPYGNREDMSRQAGSRNNRSGDNSKLVIGVVLGIIIFVTVIAGVALAGGLYLYNVYEKQMADSETGSGSRNRGSGDRDVTEKDEPVTNKQKAYCPESDMLIELVETIFDKSVYEVTQEEMESIVYLDFYEIEDSGIRAVNYELADGTGETCFTTHQSLNTEDLNCFKGLEWLSINSELDWDTDWSGLTRLKGLYCSSSLTEIAAAMNASQLVWVRSKGSLMGSDSGSIEEFKNLYHLEIDADYTESLEGISKLQTLRELVLTDAERIQDYEELYDMPQLEVLGIESKGLRDIGFVREMDNLAQLELTGTSLKNVDAIEDCADTLKVLRLERNYEVKDYSAVLQCKGLEELELYVDYNFDVPMQMPDLSELTQLKRLHLGNYDKFENLGLLTQLEELTIEDAGSGDGEGLGKLVNLKRLNLIDMSVFEGFLDSVPQLSKLETIDLTDSFVWDDISVIFKAPNLKWVYLNDAHAGLEIKNMTTCESLTGLDMTGLILDRMLEDGSWDYHSQGSDAEIAMQEIPEFFAGFPNLQVLYVPGQELEDVSFLADMEQLYYLDVSDNYITDLSPLGGLSELRIVVCKDNPLHNREGMEDVILIE